MASSRKRKTVAVSKPAEFQPYSKLPTSLIQCIFSFFNQSDLSRASRALGQLTMPLAHPTKSLARELHKILRAGKLLHYVVDADYEQAALMIGNDPLLPFERVNFIYPDGSQEHISPLRYAFKVYDTYMWKLFYEKIKNNPEQVRLFLAQEKEQTTHIDLQSLFDEYQAYEDRLTRFHGDFRRYEEYLENESKETNDEVFNAWTDLGIAQLIILPRHMLKEFLRPRKDNGWRNDSVDFDVAVIPAPQHDQLYAYNEETYCRISFSEVLSTMKWNFSLVQTVDEDDCSALHYPCNPNDTRGDAEIFQRLLEVRQEDLAKQITLLSQYSPENPEQQDQTSSTSSIKPVAR